MNLADVISSFDTGTYTVTRTATRTYDANGRISSPSTTTFSAEGCMQPLVGRELQRLPEGLRGKELKVFYTATALRTVGTGEPDSVTISGSTWEVQTCEPWDELGGYFRVILSKDGDL
jgi:hypothetical protein